MGFLRSTPKVDPLMEKLVETLTAQVANQQAFTERVIEMLGQQQETMGAFMKQYVGQGSNGRSSLDDRLYEREQRVEASEWEPMPNPFQGL